MPSGQSTKLVDQFRLTLGPQILVADSIRRVEFAALFFARTAQTFKFKFYQPMISNRRLLASVNLAKQTPDHYTLLKSAAPTSLRTRRCS